MSTLPTVPQGPHESDMTSFFAMLNDTRDFAQRLVATLPQQDPLHCLVKNVIEYLPEGPQDVSRSLALITESLRSSDMESDYRIGYEMLREESDISEDDIEQQLLSEGDDTHRIAAVPQSGTVEGNPDGDDAHNDVQPFYNGVVSDGSDEELSDDEQDVEDEQDVDVEQPVNGDHPVIPPAPSNANLPAPANTTSPSPIPATNTTPAPTPATVIPLPLTLAAPVPPPPTNAIPTPSAATPAAPAPTASTSQPLRAAPTMVRRTFERSYAFIEGSHPHVFNGYERPKDKPQEPEKPLKVLIEEEREKAKIAVRDQIGEKARLARLAASLTPSSAPTTATTSTAGTSRDVSSSNTSVKPPEAQESKSCLVEPTPPGATSVANDEEPQSTTGALGFRLVEPTPPGTTSVTNNDQSQSLAPSEESPLVEPTPPEAVLPVIGHTERSRSVSPSPTRVSCLVPPVPPASMLAPPNPQPRVDKGKKRARDNEDDVPAPGAQTSAYTFDPEVPAPDDDQRPAKRSKRTATRAAPEASSSTIPAGPSKFFASEDSSRRKSKRKSAAAEAPAPVMPKTNGRPVVMVQTKYRSKSVDIPDDFITPTPEPAAEGKKRARADDEPQPTGQTDAPSPPKKAKTSRTRTAAASKHAPVPASSRLRTVTKVPAVKTTKATTSKPVAVPSRSRKAAVQTPSAKAGQQEAGPSPSRKSTAQTPRAAAPEPEPEAGPSRPRKTARAPAPPLPPSRGTRRSSRLSKNVEPEPEPEPMVAEAQEEAESQVI